MMEFLILLVTGVTVIILLAVLGARARRRDNLSKAFHSLARKHHGVYRRQGAYEQSIEFRREGVTYRVAIEKRGRWWGGYVTLIEVSGWGNSPATSTIRPRRAFELFRRNSVGSGSIGFNMKYLVRGEPREQLKKMLSTGVRARIDLLRQAAQSKSFRVELGGGRFAVTRRGYILPYGFLDKYCDAAIWLCDEMVGVLAVGIDFSEAQYSSTDLGLCKICGDALEEEVVYCRKCETPHHKDCWVFNGECSIYACGEKRYRRAKPPSLQST